MASQDDGSVTRWIGDLKSGGESAAQHLWERYFDRLVNLARTRLRASRRVGAVEDEEDAALSAFDSFCRGASNGRFPHLADRDDLWRLLVVITLRKVSGQLDRMGARKRGGGRLVGEAALGGSGTDEAAGLDLLASDEPSPEMVVQVVEEYRRLRAGLRTEALRRVLDLRLEGYTREEIAKRLGCADRAVRRKLDVIRETWLAGEIS
jgi:DNA-directed RNA polymerase specialized sigma24 family protein